MENMSNIDAKIEEETNKPIEERDKKREFKLIYMKFIEGLKLSTGYR